MPKVSNLAFFGLVLSAYAFYVEYKHEHESDDPNEEPFVALCDIEAISASCSQVFALPEGKLLSYFGIVQAGSMLDQPNAVLGALYYGTILLTLRKNYPMLKFTMSCMAMSSSIYLAIVLTTLKELCILCWTTHILNTLLLAKFFKGLKQSKSEKTIKSV